MSSAFFRRPGEDSSDSDSDSDSSSSAEQVEVEEQSTRNTDGDGDSGSHDIELATTESLSTNASVAFPETDADSNVTSVDQLRNQMIAVLLEDYYKNRAAAALNSAHPGLNYTKDSPEVRALSDRLYTEATRELVKNDILPATVLSNDQTNQHAQYLAALDSIVYRNMRDARPAQEQLHIRSGESSMALVRAHSQPLIPSAAKISQSISELIPGVGRMGLASPTADMALTMSKPKQLSIYEQNFQQLKLLGKGGFGKVYHAHNVLDLKEYAIKKIPLSPRLTRSYQQGGHEELEIILREVKALAQLDHCNVVRYHTTWIEEPKSSSKRSSGQFHPHISLPRQRLLADQPHDTPSLAAKVEASEGIVFGFDSSRRPSYVNDAANGWSVNESVHNSTSVRASQLWTDDQARGSTSTDSSLDDTVCVLHVQMSLYPMTLTQYLAPTPSTSTSAPTVPKRRHCYHLIPSLRIILGILNGLQYIHAKGLVHRDIKPGNIFLSHADPTTTSTTFTSSEGYYDVGSCPACPSEHSLPYHVNPRIGDFGLVAELALADTKLDSPTTAPHPPSSPSKPVGTEYYRPPTATDASGQNNQHTSTAIDEKIDVYALGIIFVELLWQCDTSAERIHVLRDLQRGRLPRALGPAVDTEGHDGGVGDSVRDCVRGMIEVDARERWGCQRVREAVVGILGRCRFGMREGRSGEGLGEDVGMGMGEGLGRVTSLSGTDDGVVEAEQVVGRSGGGGGGGGVG